MDAETGKELAGIEIANNETRKTIDYSFPSRARPDKMGRRCASTNQRTESHVATTGTWLPCNHNGFRPGFAGCHHEKEIAMKSKIRMASGLVLALLVSCTVLWTFAGAGPAGGKLDEGAIGKAAGSKATTTPEGLVRP